MSSELIRWNLPAAFEGIKDNAIKDVLRDIYSKLNSFHAGTGVRERVDKKRSIFYDVDQQYIRNKIEEFGALSGSVFIPRYYIENANTNNWNVLNQNAYAGLDAMEVDFNIHSTNDCAFFLFSGIVTVDAANTNCYVRLKFDGTAEANSERAFHCITTAPNLSALMYAKEGLTKGQHTATLQCYVDNPCTMTWTSLYRQLSAFIISGKERVTI